MRCSSALSALALLAPGARVAPRMGLLDVFKQAFENEDLDGPQRAPSPSAVTAERLASASWELSLAVKGISSSDNPSADLYGPRTSVRFGALIEPLEATVPLSLLDGGVARVGATSLTTVGPGRWWLQGDELQLEVETPGVERVSTWKADALRRGFDELGSSSYTVPEGKLYLRGVVESFGTRMGVTQGTVLVRVERGRFNVVFSQCGKFNATATVRYA